MELRVLTDGNSIVIINTDMVSFIEPMADGRQLVTFLNGVRMVISHVVSQEKRTSGLGLAIG